MTRLASGMLVLWVEIMKLLVKTDSNNVFCFDVIETIEDVVSRGMLFNI